ncbi:GGDEF domain-containing protein [Desulfocurvus sp. DL9XJH121]
MAMDTVQQEHLDAVSELTVLLVEDDLFLRDTLAGLLERAVGSVLVAGETREAPALSAGHDPDVCLIGLSPGDDSGFETMSRIRAGRPDAVIFAAVSLDDRGLVERALDLDVDRVLAKPVYPATLLTALSRSARALPSRAPGSSRDSLRCLADCLADPALLARDGGVGYVNKALLALLGHENHDSFVRAGGRVGDHLELLEGRSWPGGDGWLERVLDARLDSDPLLTLRCVRDSLSRSLTFRAQARPLPTPDLQLVLLSEVCGPAAGEGDGPRDALTGAYSRSRLLELLADQERKVSHGGGYYSLIMLDVDRLGAINEACGLERGDKVLQELSRVVADNVRSTDILARWEGGRFAVLSPDSDYRRGNRVAERLRRKMEGSDFPGVDFVVTASFGVGQAGMGESAVSLVARVERALGMAKASGRNRVVLSTVG